MILKLYDLFYVGSLVSGILNIIFKDPVAPGSDSFILPRDRIWVLDLEVMFVAGSY